MSELERQVNYGTFRPDLQGSKLTTEEKEKLHGLLEEFSELFDDGELGWTSKIRHAHLGHQFDNLHVYSPTSSGIEKDSSGGGTEDAEEQGYSSKYQSLVFTYYNGSEERRQLAVLYRLQKT